MSPTVTESKEAQIKRIHDAFTMFMRISKRWFVQHLQSFGLTLPQFITLATLAAHRQACTMSDLTNVTFQDPPTTTGIVDRLVKMDLLQRTRSQIDRRVVLVEATPAGVDLVNQIEQGLMEAAMPTFDILTEEELTSFEYLLGRLLRGHLQQFMAIKNTDLDAEIEKMERFVKDPIAYMKLEVEKTP
jgi:DNA-binding MarR family transcriptional regulator